MIQWAQCREIRVSSLQISSFFFTGTYPKRHIFRFDVPKIVLRIHDQIVHIRLHAYTLGLYIAR